MKAVLHMQVLKLFQKITQDKDLLLYNIALKTTSHKRHEFRLMVHTHCFPTPHTILQE